MTEPPYITATRIGYDLVAADYGERFRDVLAGLPVERALLTAFAELVHRSGPGLVADLGCGPGIVTAYLTSLGIDVFGLDLSPEMVRLARRTHPQLRFDEGSMTALNLPDGTLAAAVAFYSTMHVADDGFPGLLAELHRALAPRGHLLLAFLAGDGLRTMTEWFDRAVSLQFQLRRPAEVVDLVRRSGFDVLLTAERAPHDDEQLPRGFVLARRGP